MHAIIHTKGVVLNERYVPLELAYRDICGLLCHFQITSPMTFSQMRKMFPDCRPDVDVSVNKGTPYSDALTFLRNRYEFLQSKFPEKTIVFGYKGEKYQPQILHDADIFDTVNVEMYGVPPLNSIPATTAHVSCFLHKGKSEKCALVALNRITSYFL